MITASRPTILILTTHTGGGHLNLAQALKGILEARYNVSIVNPQSALADSFYSTVSRHGLKFLAWQYTWTDTKIASLWFQRAMTLFERKRIHSIIEQIQPQLIITTHALLSYATARVNERHRKRVPLVFQLTDLGQVHMTWFAEKQADAYFAPTSEIFAQAQAQDIAPNRLYLTGRPVRRQFWEVSLDTRSETLSALELDPATFTIFLQGGAMGSAGVDQTIECLLSADVPLQIMLAVGTNKEMALRYVGHKRIRTLPFTEMIAPYMAAADMIAGKAGASFISEAFVLEKPFLVTTFIPGQETPNLQFIERHNLGWVCPKTADQQALFSSIANNPGMIAAKVASIRAYKAWNMLANQHLCPIIDQLLS